MCNISYTVPALLLVHPLRFSLSDSWTGRIYGSVYYMMKPRLRWDQSCRPSSSYSSTAPVHAQTDPAAPSRHSDCLSAHSSASLYYYHSDCRLVSFALAKHFISKKSPALALTFPFAETEQSFTNHTAKCKISKQFGITGLMK